MRALNLLGSGDAAEKGIGTMTQARWQKTYEFLVTGKILAPTVPWTSAFTTQFVDGLNVLPV